MAGDWIKMRGGLFNSPKLIAMAKYLQGDRSFRDWMTPGGGGEMNGQIVSDCALRCVTGALLCVTWSWSREFGKALPNGDCFLQFVEIADLDGIAGAPCIGDAMRRVGWAIESEDPEGVILPKFFLDHNVPLTPSEKQRAYRERKRRQESVTKTLPSDGNKTVTREEKRREEKKKKPPTPFSPTDVWLPFQQDSFREAWSDFCTHRKEIKKPLTPTATKQALARLEEMGLDRSVAALRHTTANGWQGIREPDTRPQRRHQGDASDVATLDAEADRILEERKCRK